ncbi:MAG: stage II sporulation protein D [Sarcina sp.]
MKINYRLLNDFLIGSGILLLIFLIPIIFGIVINVKGKDKEIKSFDGNTDININTNLKSLKDMGINLENVKVFLPEKNKVEEIDMEKYVLGVVSSEMPASFEKDALIAQAILARTFVISKKLSPCKQANGADICSTVHCQAYTNPKDKEKNLNTNGKELFNKIEEAVSECKGMVLSYNNILVKYPQYFSTSWGKTEDAQYVFSIDVPYLKSVESPGEEVAPRYKENFIFSNEEFVNKFNSKFSKSNLTVGNLKNNVEIISKNPGGTVNELKIGGVTVKGTEFRSIYGLNSASFNININNKVEIECLGYGHGVGMSQWGANIMAKEGKDFKDILKHYFIGCDIISIESCKVE